LHGRTISCDPNISKEVWIAHYGGRIRETIPFSNGLTGHCFNIFLCAVGSDDIILCLLLYFKELASSLFEGGRTFDVPIAVREVLSLYDLLDFSGSASVAFLFRLNLHFLEMLVPQIWGTVTEGFNLFINGNDLCLDLLHSILSRLPDSDGEGGSSVQNLTLTKEVPWILDGS
jgi:hypothetical protein